MEITQEYARKLIRAGKAHTDGRTVDQGWIWEIITRIDKQRVDHVRVERTTTSCAIEIMAWPNSINQVAAAMGRKGGASKSTRKIAASRKNGLKGGRPKL